MSNGRKLEPAMRQALLARILTSPHFAHAYSLRRILEYICRSTADQAAPAPKEFDIAVEALGRSDSFDPKTDPIIRVSIGGIRERLKAYFENEGRTEPVHLSIPKGQYRAVFSEAEVETAQQAADGARKLFWGSYLNPRGPNILVYTEVLFFRDDKGNFARNIYVNNLASGASELPGRGLPLPPASLRPSFHFVSAGEMVSLLSISQTFQELKAPLEVRNSRFFSWTEMQGANLILLGSARTNPFLNSLQGKEPFVITPDCIQNTLPLPGEPDHFCGRRFFEGQLERVIEYALVTRRPGLGPDSSITLIAANHGRAIEGAGQFLTREDRVRSLTDALQIRAQQPLPGHFQVLLRVDMIDYVEEVVHVECVSHRVLD